MKILGTNKKENVSKESIGTVKSHIKACPIE